MAGFYWYDYETWGSEPRRDRPCQFAGLRTDADLNEIQAPDSPLKLFCRPATDLLPFPDACMITGIGPRQASDAGLPEAEFAARIERAFGQPGTCVAGYNSIRFDDEVTRFLFYRNFIDPYAHHYRDGNSRWDLIDTLRLAQALRPDGLHWPTREDGTPSFQLGALCAANAIPLHDAHDALADVRATVALARRLRVAQPRLFAYALGLRDKQRVRELLDSGQPLLHVSARYPAARGCLAPVGIVGRHPFQEKLWLAFDLRQDPAMLLDLSVEAIRQRLFVPNTELPPEVERLPLKGIRANAVPMVAPLKTLNADAAQRWAIDLAQVAIHAQRLADVRLRLPAKLAEIYQPQVADAVEADPDFALYRGGFFSDADRRAIARVRATAPEQLAQMYGAFEDQRLPKLLFRYRARNWPETLSAAERADWDAWRCRRLTDPQAGAAPTPAQYRQRLAELRAEHAGDGQRLALCDDLDAWAEAVLTGCAH